MQNRAYALLTVKAVQEDKRIIRGVATTPTVDRVGDIIEPMGVKFTNPLPLLWQHRHDQPIGTVKFDAPTEDGITFEAEIPSVDEPGSLKDRIDEAWQSIKMGLVKAVSVGFRAIEYSFIEGTNGIRFIETEVYELSAVTIPANADAVITSKAFDAEAAAVVKSFDTNVPAATGEIERPTKTAPGASGKSTSVNLRPKEAIDMKTIAEQIAALEAARQAKAARMAEVMQKSMDEGRSTDEAEQEEFDTLEQEVEALDGDLKRLRSLEKSNANSAKAVVASQITNESEGANARAGVVVKTKPDLAPGIRMARVIKCIGLAKGNLPQAQQIAMSAYQDDDAVVNVLKAAVAAGSTTNETWVGNLVGDESSVYADFVEYLRPLTIIGRFGANGIPSLRRVPFRVALVGQTSGGSGYWVGEGAAKPLTAFDFSRTTLEPLKVANIAVLTMEAVRDSSPSAETIVRDQLVAALRERLDIDFIEPAKTAVAGVSPASITNGATSIASTGVDEDSVRLDIRALFQVFIAANNAPSTGVFVMSATNALALGLMVNALGQVAFPGIGMNGGAFFGLPVIVSEHIGDIVALVNAQDVYLADEGGFTVDMSDQASLQMDDAPDNPTTAATVLVSLWQRNMIGFRAERTINWARRRASSVAYLTGVNWGGDVPAS